MKGRRLVDLYTAYASKAELGDYEDQFPAEFMHDLALRMMDYRKLDLDVVGENERDR